MRRLAAATVVLASGLLLTGCTGAFNSDEQAVEVDPKVEYLTENSYRLMDGRTVSCIVYEEGYAGGVSCDWQNAQ